MTIIQRTKSFLNWIGKYEFHVLNCVEILHCHGLIFIFVRHSDNTMVYCNMFILLWFQVISTVAGIFHISGYVSHLCKKNFHVINLLELLIGEISKNDLVDASYGQDVILLCVPDPITHMQYIAEGCFLPVFNVSWQLSASAK